MPKTDPVGFEKVIFRQALEALFLRALKEKMTPALQSALKECGLDLSRELQPAYAFSDFRKMQTVSLHSLYGPEPTNKNQREFGRLWTDGYFQTFMGAALLGILKLIGPRRSMLRSEKNYSTVGNYNLAKTVELAPNHFELKLKDVEDWPGISEGSLQRSLELTGAKNVQTRFVRIEGDYSVFEATWS
jgi:uncharacterized protein (TIGR02265 family)